MQASANTALSRATEGVGASEGVSPRSSGPESGRKSRDDNSEWRTRSATVHNFEWHTPPARVNSAMRKSGHSGGSGENTLARTRARLRLLEEVHVLLAAVVRGNRPSKDGKCSFYCAVIVKKVDEKTRAKTSLNELLRTVD